MPIKNVVREISENLVEISKKLWARRKTNIHPVLLFIILQSERLHLWLTFPLSVLGEAGAIAEENPGEPASGSSHMRTSSPLLWRSSC